MLYLKSFLSLLLFVAGVLLFYDYIEMNRTMSLRPCSIHMWAQCERASVALNYYENGMNLFFPQVHKFTHGTGITGMEFPLVNYIPAICYKLFGFNEIYYRGFVFLTFLFGLFMFYRLLNSFTHNYFVSLGLLAAGSFSPVLIYYANNFMPDVTSLGFALSAWFYFFKFKDSLQKKHMWMFFVFAVLAALIKITSLIVMLVVLCVIVLDAFGFFKKQYNGFLFDKRTKKKLALGIFAGVVIVFSWYAYASWLSNHYKAEAFALSPTIVSGFDNIIWHLDVILKAHRFEYYPYEAYVLFAVIIVALIIGYKFVSRLLFTITLLTILGSLCFAYLMFSQFREHDYYIIPLLPCTFLLLLTFADFLNRLSIKFSRLIPYVFLAILFFNLKESGRACKREFGQRYDPKFVRWNADFEPYWDLEGKLRRLGVQRTDYTLCGFEESFCNGLYLMDQLGNTLSSKISPTEIKKQIDNPRYKYLVVNDTAKLNKLYQGNLQEKVFATHRGLFIYKLR